MSATCEWGHIDHLKDFSPLCQVSRIQRLRLKQTQLQKGTPGFEEPHTAADKHVLNMVNRRSMGGLTIRSSVNTRPLPVTKA